MLKGLFQGFLIPHSNPLALPEVVKNWIYREPDFEFRYLLFLHGFSHVGTSGQQFIA